MLSIPKTYHLSLQFDFMDKNFVSLQNMIKRIIHIFIITLLSLQSVIGQAPKDENIINIQLSLSKYIFNDSHSNIISPISFGIKGSLSANPFVHIGIRLESFLTNNPKNSGLIDGYELFIALGKEKLQYAFGLGVLNRNFQYSNHLQIQLFHSRIHLLGGYKLLYVGGMESIFTSNYSLGIAYKIK